MFKGKIYVYKNVNGKEEEISKQFDDEKEFDEFIKKNPSLIDAKKFGFKDTKGSSSLFDIRGFLEEAEKMGQSDWIKEIEDDLKRIFEKSKRLLK